MRAYALSLPEAWEDHPWGESVIKVGKKIFVFLGIEEPDDKWEPGFRVKLPQSAGHALAVPGAEPAGYGLGKAGWVHVPFRTELPETELLIEWIEESYRTVAPKKLVARLDE